MSIAAAFERAKDLERRARDEGFSASTDQIARWSREGLLPRKLKQHGFGQGSGSEIRYPVGTGDQLIALCFFRFTERYRKSEAVGWYLWLNGFNVSDKYWQRPLALAATAFIDNRRQIKRRLVDTAMGIASLRPAGLRALADLSGTRSENRQFRRARRRVGATQIGEFCRLMTTIAVGIYRVHHNEVDQQEESSILKRGFGLARAYTDHLDNGAPLLSQPFELDLEKFSTRLRKVSRPSLLRSITRDRMRQACDDLRLLFSGLIGTYFNLEKKYGHHAFGLGVIADFGTITDMRLQALLILLFDATIRSDTENRLREILSVIEAKRVSNAG